MRQSAAKPKIMQAYYEALRNVQRLVRMDVGENNSEMEKI